MLTGVDHLDRSRWGSQGEVTQNRVQPYQNGCLGRRASTQANRKRDKELEELEVRKCASQDLCRISKEQSESYMCFQNLPKKTEYPLGSPGTNKIRAQNTPKAEPQHLLEWSMLFLFGEATAFYSVF